MRDTEFETVFCAGAEKKGEIEETGKFERERDWSGEKEEKRSMGSGLRSDILLGGEDTNCGMESYEARPF